MLFNNEIGVGVSFERSSLNAANELSANPFAQFEDRQEDRVPTATLQIYQFIDQYLARGKDINVNRASAASMCVRRRWYQAHGHEGTPLTPRKMVNFLLGDLTERTLLYFIKSALVGDGKVYSEVDFGENLGAIHFQGKPLELYSQKTMSFDLDGMRITGHADGFGKRNSDGKWELIEIKSAADYGFDKFVDDGPGDYIKQSHALMMTNECRAKNISEVRYYYLRKNTGNLFDKLCEFDQSVADLVKREFLEAMSDVIPERPHELTLETYYKKPTGRLIAGFPCSYCPFIEACHGPHEKEFKSGKPKFVFKKEEVTNGI